MSEGMGHETIWQVHKASFIWVGWHIDFFLEDDFHETCQWHLLILRVSPFEVFSPIHWSLPYAQRMFLRFLPGVKAWHRAAVWH